MLLVVLMSLSLVGIIAVQLYWIKSSVEDKEDQFSKSVSEVLSRVSDKIEERETSLQMPTKREFPDSFGELCGVL